MQSTVPLKLPRPALILVMLALTAFVGNVQSASFLEKVTGQTAQPVEPELAFSVKVRNTGPQQVMLDFTVRPDYYLYRERISVTLKDAPARRIKNIEFPQATIKEDKVFGRMSVYTKSFSVPVKLEGKPGSPASLFIQYQGCYGTIGVCYPPATAMLKVAP